MDEFFQTVHEGRHFDVLGVVGLVESGRVGVDGFSTAVGEQASFIRAPSNPGMAMAERARRRRYPLRSANLKVGHRFGHRGRVHEELGLGATSIPETCQRNSPEYIISHRRPGEGKSCRISRITFEASPSTLSPSPRVLQRQARYLPTLSRHD